MSLGGAVPDPGFGRPPRVSGWRAGIPVNSPPAPYDAPRREEGDAGEERVPRASGQEQFRRPAIAQPMLDNVTIGARAP